MFRILGNKYILLVIVVLLMALSSFSVIQSSSSEIPRGADDNDTFSAPDDLSHIVVDPGKENEHEAGNTDDNEPEPEPIRIELEMPDFLPMNTTLKAEVTLFNAIPGVNSLLTWYFDDEILIEEWVETDTELSMLSHDFEYNHKLPESVTVKAVLRYFTGTGNVEYISDEKKILLENHDRTYWMELEADRVLGMVSSTYKGNRTLKWAQENDYDDFDKEVFVSMKGYESKTDYLIWVNRAYQRANIFQGSAGNWELIKTFIVATGSPTTMTRRGVSEIPSRTAAGWNFGHFIVEPVVRFFPGTRYAFHSRPLNPRTKKVSDERIGFPVSAGCVRMYCDDIWYIYDNIPDGTTVVIN